MFLLISLYMFVLLIYNCTFLVQCPTTIVPFFGDQFFWGERIHAIGVGPAPIPISELNVERLSSAIEFMLDPEVTESV